MKPGLPHDEAARLRALQSYELLDTEPEKEFDDLTLLAAQICGAPIATISLIDENRQWFKSKIGLTEGETSHDISFCAHGIRQTDVFVIKDAREDERFADNPLVTGDPHVRFYAGAPLKSTKGHALGMICVYDRVPRDLTSEQVGALKALSRQVVAQMELQRASKELRKTVAELEKIQEELHSRTAFFEATISASEQGMLLVDNQNRKILQNERMNELWKIPREIVEEQDDKKQLDWVSSMAMDPVSFREKVRHLYSHPEEVSHDLIELKEGTILDRHSSPIVGKDGKYYGRIWSFYDVTERNHAEETLRQSEEKFRQLAENISDVFWSTSTDMRKIHYVSPAYETTWGRTVKSLQANPRQWIEAVVPEDLERVSAVFEGLMANEPNISVEYRIARPDGAIRWIHDRGYQVPDSTGKVVRLTGIAADITERKLIEERIERLRHEHEAVINSVSEGVQWIDGDGTIRFENQAAAKLLGYEPSELLGQQAHHKMHHSRSDGGPYPLSECPIYATLRDGVIRHVTNEVFWRKDASSFPVEYTSTPIRDSDGLLAGTVVVFKDITSRKQMEARLFQSQKMETVGKLAGGVAHEFNSILTAIIGQSERLVEELPAKSSLSKSAREIRTAADRAATLTRQLLAYGRKQILQPEILDLNRVIASMAGTLKHLMGEEVDVRITPAYDLHKVKIDPGQMDQVILSIAMNAIDAMPNGGKLTVETSNVVLDEDYVRPVTGLKPGGYVMLAISDTGIGMSEEVKARAFEPFFSTKSPGEGTGLGLATCYGIIKQSEGHITLYSEPARGTTVRIYIPLLEAVPKTSRLPEKAPNLPHGTETILLAEDDPSLLEMAAGLLRRLGYTVLTASDGVEALTLKNQRNIGHIDLLLTDVVMPHMSGKELSERVRAIYPQTKILFTSAFTESAFIHQGMLNGDVALLQKPFTPSALANKVREVLDQKTPTHENDSTHR